MGNPPLFNLGSWRSLDGKRGGNPLLSVISGSHVRSVKTAAA